MEIVLYLPTKNEIMNNNFDINEELNLENFKSFLNSNYPNLDLNSEKVLSNYNHYVSIGLNLAQLQNCLNKIKPYFKEIEIDLTESGYLEKVRDQHNKRIFELPFDEFLCFSVDVCNELSYNKRKNRLMEDWNNIVIKWKSKVE